MIIISDGCKNTDCEVVRTEPKKGLTALIVYHCENDDVMIGASVWETFREQGEKS